MAAAMPNSEEPPQTHDHALSQLRYIRSTMDGATRFTAVPGNGTAVIGVTAFVAAALAQLQSTRDAMLLVWVGEALVAGGIGLAALFLKSRRAGVDLARGPGPQIRAGVAAVGDLRRSGVVGARCARANDADSGGLAHRLRIGGDCRRYAFGADGSDHGRGFVVAGLAALFVASAVPERAARARFRRLHIAFGIHIARHHGG